MRIGDYLPQGSMVGIDRLGPEAEDLMGRMEHGSHVWECTLVSEAICLSEELLLTTHEDR